jgi:hypothetical protein
MVPDPLGGVVAVFALALEVLALVLLVVLDVLEVLELPHAARPNASTAQPASALILFLITASPLAGLSFDGAWRTRLSALRRAMTQSLQPPVVSM